MDNIKVIIYHSNNNNKQWCLEINVNEDTYFTIYNYDIRILIKLFSKEETYESAPRPGQPFRSLSVSETVNNDKNISFDDLKQVIITNDDLTFYYHNNKNKKILITIIMLEFYANMTHCILSCLYFNTNINISGNLIDPYNDDGSIRRLEYCFSNKNFHFDVKKLIDFYHIHKEESDDEIYPLLGRTWASIKFLQKHETHFDKDELKNTKYFYYQLN